ncbi:MFS transporter [Roseomonas sp. OT10]|uniref:MFS transporter n=1 Tax=Roseomonas cutis TaxID=2897332 RepID=UPI001E484E19|nr:MFS transporter [Roseomonas sp. OT10]UFN47105.1 MFS transporter [Roseomonas sp. OT10]
MPVLRQRPFLAFLLANVLERFAAAAMTVLLGFQVYELTHDPLDLGWLGLVEAIPGVTLVLYGGHVADRLSRRRIVIAAQVALTVLAAGIALLSAAAPAGLLPLLFLAAFLAGVARAFQGPAASGLEAQVVPVAQLIRGLGLLATSGRLADVAGPVAGGFAWSWLGGAETYGAIAVLLAASCLTVWLGVPERPPLHAVPEAGTTTVWRRIAEGVRYVLGNPYLGGSMALDMFAVFFGGATALLPVFATDVLGVGAEGLGLLRAASGLGALLAALGAARFLPQHRAGVALHAVIAGFGVSIIVFGVSTSLPLSLAALFVAGLCDGTSVVIRRAILRLASPEAMRGRIAAVRSVFVGSSNELGAFESGLAASLLGAQAAVWSGGFVTLAIVAVTFLAMPRLRRMDLVEMAKAEERRGRA